MTGIEIILWLLVAATALAWVARYLNVPYPLLLVVGGLAVGFLPGLPQIVLRPEYVFLLFLPPLLYYEALLTSWRDFRANLRPIGFLAVGLTLFTTVGVAVVARFLVPGIEGWPEAFVLGAIVSPPDAIAATAVAQRLRVPRRVVVLLEGESLINDAIALVAYRFGVAAAVAGYFSLPVATVQFVAVSIGGIALGLLVGYAVSLIRPHIHDPMVEGALTLLTPFIAYLPAEYVRVSGVLSCVTAGLVVAYRLPYIAAPTIRLRQYATWDNVTFLLNGLVFILIGLQLPGVLEGLGDRLTIQLVLSAIGLSGAVIAIRLLWVLPATYVPRWLSPALRKRGPIPPFGEVFLVGWTGMRGIVSLAAALALPVQTKSGEPFPARDVILFLTFCVILATLLAQGLTLSTLIQWLGLKDDGAEARDEEVTARYLAALAGLERLDALAAEGRGLPETIRQVRVDYDRRVEYFSRQLAHAPNRDPTDGEPDLPYCDSDVEVRRQALSAQRRMLVQLRDNGVIADDVLRRVQHELDLEEIRLGGG